MRVTAAFVPLAGVLLLACGKSRSDSPSPPPSTPGRHGQHIVELARGGEGAYALLDDGTLHAWGQSTSGSANAVPLPVKGLVGKFVHVRSTSPHACAVNEAGEAWCWGSNELGALGNGSSLPLGSAPMAPVKAVVSDAKSACVDAGFSCACIERAP